MVFNPLTYLMYDYVTKTGVTPVTADDLKPGDHIFVLTPVKVGQTQIAQFSHHAVFVGPQNIGGIAKPSIVHLNPPVVVMKPVERLSNKYQLYRIEHADVPNKHAIVQRCIDALKPNNYPKFNYLTGNCEHFANYCVFGKPFSNQIWPLKVAGASALGVGVAAAAVLLHQKKLRGGGGGRRVVVSCAQKVAQLLPEANNFLETRVAGLGVDNLVKVCDMVRNAPVIEVRGGGEHVTSPVAADDVLTILINVNKMHFIQISRDV